jgi:tol-pal system protein YbgF
MRNKRLFLLGHVCSTFLLTTSHAALFTDDDARRAILELRQRVESQRVELDRRQAEDSKRLAEDNAQLRRSLLDLQNQIELLKAELARLQGAQEQLARGVSDVQRQQKDAVQGLDDRFRKLEPLKITIDGREFLVDQAEKREFEAALALFKTGDFPNASIAFGDFLKRYSQSGYTSAANFWQGNARYVTKEYKDAIQNFRNVVSLSPNSSRAPEAVLSIANCLVELKDLKAARKTLEDLIQAYPQSEAASAAKERLSRFK